MPKNETTEIRLTEIHKAITDFMIDYPVIPIIPERMTEAWLLHDESAIKHAANNPNGKNVLPLPNVKNVHKIKDPKSLLESLLLTANGNNKRRLKNFRPRRRMHRVAELIDDYQSLLVQPSFADIEQYLRGIKNIEKKPRHPIG